MEAFFIPGNGEDLKSRNYKAVLDMYKRQGYKPHFVTINWKYRTIDHWVSEVSNKISGKEIKDSLLSGFSFGSMIALGVAARTNPKKLLLYSLSPYFREDRPFPSKYLKWHGKRRMENFRKFSMNELAAQVHSPTILFIGSKEIEKYADTMGRRAKLAHRTIQNSKLVIVKGASHDVGDPAYVKAIKGALNT